MSAAEKSTHNILYKELSTNLEFKNIIFGENN